MSLNLWEQPSEQAVGHPPLGSRESERTLCCCNLGIPQHTDHKHFLLASETHIYRQDVARNQNHTECLTQSLKCCLRALWRENWRKPRFFCLMPQRVSDSLTVRSLYLSGWQWSKVRKQHVQRNLNPDVYCFTGMGDWDLPRRLLPSKKIHLSVQKNFRNGKAVTIRPLSGVMTAEPWRGGLARPIRPRQDNNEIFLQTSLLRAVIPNPA